MRQQLNLPKTTPRQEDIHNPEVATKSVIQTLFPRIKSYLRGVERINPQDSAQLVSRVDSAALAPRHTGGQPR